MTVTSRSSFSLPALMFVATLACGGALLVPQQAQALEWQGGFGLKGGVHFGLTDDADFDAGLGWGGGAQGYFLVRPVSMFAIGLNFDYTYYSSVNDAQTIGVDYSLPSFGIIARVLGVSMAKGQPTSGWGGSLWLNYMFGSACQVSSSGADPIVADYSGAQVGLNVLYQIRVSPYKSLVEIGGYASYNFADLDKGDTATNPLTSDNSIQIGITAQMTFQSTF